MPDFAVSNMGESPNASDEMNSDMVKPIPASQLTP